MPSHAITRLDHRSLVANDGEVPGGNADAFGLFADEQTPELLKHPPFAAVESARLHSTLPSGLPLEGGVTMPEPCDQFPEAEVSENVEITLEASTMDDVVQLFTAAINQTAAKGAAWNQEFVRRLWRHFLATKVKSSEKPLAELYKDCTLDCKVRRKSAETKHLTPTKNGGARCRRSYEIWMRRRMFRKYGGYRGK